MDSKPSSSSVYPETINPIVVTVHNTAEDMKWYTGLLGFAVIKQSVEILANDSNWHCAERYSWSEANESADGMVESGQSSGPRNLRVYKGSG